MSEATAPTSLQTILDQFRDDARNNRDLGDRFERLILAYLQLDPLYVDRFSDVWMWNDWPDKGRVGDVGIDLVAKERATGEYCAIQCKFYLPEHTLSKDDLDSFFAALGKPAISTGLIVSTTDKWGKNAEDALNQTKPVTRLSVHDLADSPVDWSTFDTRKPAKLALSAKKKLRPHQKAALKDVVDGFKGADRGKLIMACGTGKTFTALKIAETVAPTGHVLFLVPSLSLMSQTLREWTAESDQPLRCLAVCSDVNIGKRREKNEDDVGEITLHDLAFPATTNARQLVAQYNSLKALARKMKEPSRLTVVYSTYQSLEAVSKAQKMGLPDFDLIICDEAHRTTGVTLTGEDESSFVKVHDAKFLSGTKRLYMTATPRIYGDDAKTKAKEATAELASMDDEELFGKELHRLGFGKAVGDSLLSDYKVLVLAVDEKYVSKAFQKQIADKNTELNLDDAVKITGCWNGLNKKFEKTTTATDGSGDAVDLRGDVAPMRRAVAFSRSIKDSKGFVAKFGQIVTAYKEDHPDDASMLEIEAGHVDGTFDALRRGALLDWLKAESPANTCRILSNAKCLSEGVDVPALDSVIFLNPRNSVIDVVQSVGRVMRKSEGKRYGYIILPVGIPADVTPEEALRNNEKYKVVWQVLQALRAHDDRFNATINQLELNKNRPGSIQVIGVGGSDTEGDKASPGDSSPKVQEVQGVFAFPQLEEWKDAIYARMVLKVGDRAYWETWARDIAAIAEKHVTRIKALLDDPKSRHTKAFNEFLAGLQHNLNPAVSREDAVEMLAQHLITKPVFDALFANYAFTQHNPVSLSMQKMLNVLHDQSMEKETATLEKFYSSVRDRAKGLDNAEARQKVVIELYDEFFRTAFPRMAERLGIVYTPVEVVDFIIQSVQDVLRDEFKSGLGEKDVHIIDPFTGTGTFLVRLLQSGLIPPDKLLHKYRHELHANEIVLLAYYIAAINIEETFHGLRGGEGKGKDDYLPFDGIVLTDTFQLYESKQQAFEGTFPENSARVKRQKASPIRVVIANPPYSVGQESTNDTNQNLSYPALDKRIGETSAARSTATNKNSCYDSYKRAIRWAADRIQSRGIVGFVINGSFIDGNTDDGLRACLSDEFTTLYVFNLRGNQRTSGELSRQEGGKIFGSGSRAPIAITLLVKNPAKKSPATLRYYDIGDYLDRDTKLKTIRTFVSIRGIESEKKWTTLSPNAQHDWINQRDPAFDNFLPLDDDPKAVFAIRSNGVQTNRDDWAQNLSRDRLKTNMKRMSEFYHRQMKLHGEECKAAGKDAEKEASDRIDTNPKEIKWTRGLIANLCRIRKAPFAEERIGVSLYRPYSKSWIYYDRVFNEYYKDKLYPDPKLGGVVIAVSGAGVNKEFSCIITNVIADVQSVANCQCYPLHYYEKADESGDLPGLAKDAEIIDGYRRRDAITDAILKTFRGVYGPKVTKEDVFYYVYGVLHSPEYRTRFAADLKKMLPRIPLTKEAGDFKAFSKAGRKLAEWHLNYETVPTWPVEEIHDRLDLGLEETYKVQKMTFARPTAEQRAQGLKWDKTRIIYNSHVTISKIPLEAYEYVVNGKPAIEWIIERYQVTRDKDSGIVNDPNDWCKEHKQPRYIVDLIARVVRVSIQTMKIVKGLPALNERVNGDS
jgi:predicted helicase